MAAFIYKVPKLIQLRAKLIRKFTLYSINIKGVCEMSRVSTERSASKITLKQKKTTIHAVSLCVCVCLCILRTDSIQ